MHLEEFAVVEQVLDDLVHVVGLVGRVRDERVEKRVVLVHVGLDVGVEDRRRVQVVARQVGEQRLDVVDRVVLVGGEVVRDAAVGVVRPRATQLFQGDVLAGHGLHDVGAGDEHLRGLVDHDDEVGERGGVDVTAGRGAHDQRDLRDDAGCLHVAVEDLAVQAERDDALLDARPTALVDADDRAAVLQREVEHLDDLLAVHLAEAAAEYGDVLAEHADRAAVDGAVAGDHAVAERAVLVHAERGRAVPGELVEFHEGALVEQGRDPFARGLLALGVLLLDGPGGACVYGFVIASFEIGQFARSRVRVEIGNVGTDGLGCHGLRA